MPRVWRQHTRGVGAGAWYVGQRMSRSAYAGPTLVATLAAALMALALGAPSPVRAYEDQLTLEFGVGYAHAFSDGAVPSSGLPLAIAASMGINDVWTVRASVAYALHPGDPTVHVGVFGAELLYVVDILEVVPYFGAGLDALTTLSDGAVGADLGAHIVLGVDWLLSRSAYLGLDLRPYLLVSELFEADVRFPVYLTVLARAGLVFDL